MEVMIPWIIAACAAVLLAVMTVLFILAAVAAKKKASNEQMLIELFHLVHQYVKGNDERFDAIIDSQAARIEKCVNAEKENKRTIKELSERCSAAEEKLAQQKEAYDAEMKALKAKCNGLSAKGKGTQSTQDSTEELSELRKKNKSLEAEVGTLKKKLAAKPAAGADGEAAARLAAASARAQRLEEAVDSARVILKKTAGASSAEYMNEEIEKATKLLDKPFED